MALLKANVNSISCFARCHHGWLYFDSKVTTYAELHRLNRRDIHFVTIRRRGAAVVRRLRQLPASAWQKAVIDTPRRYHQNVRYVDERVRLRE